MFRFLRFIDEQQEAEVRHEPAASATENTVRLMTIHQSKGLEFSVVVVAGLGVPFNFQDLKQDILLDERYGVCPKVAPPDGCRRYPSLAHWLARRRQKREALGEELRLLYVAMTRARDALILTATASVKGDPKWSSAESRPLSAQEILAARSYFAWLRLWLPQVTRAEDWVSDHEGANDLLRWKIHDPNDPWLATAHMETGHRTGDGLALPSKIERITVKERWTWQYPFDAATTEPAKTSLSALQRRLRDETDGETRTLFQDSAYRPQVGSGAHAVTGKLSAADIGTAHHLFLQMARLDRVVSLPDLKGEVERLRQAAVLADEEAAALDLDALLAFWQSEPGRRIRAQPPQNVHREMPFTARMSPADLRAAMLPVNDRLRDDEFVVVQGVIDLAVILAKEIWLVDFKTDHLTARRLEEKAAFYGPQLRLYGLALGRIHRRPVAQSWLHFLALQKTVSVR